MLTAERPYRQSPYVGVDVVCVMFRSAELQKRGSSSHTGTLGRRVKKFVAVKTAETLREGSFGRSRVQYAGQYQ